MSDKRCPDCNVEVGEVHTDHCDIETCPECGTQRMSCGCTSELPAIPWKGKCEYVVAADEYGLYCYEDSAGYGKPEMNYGHIPCSKDHPEAHLDLNRVGDDCTWDKGQQKWVMQSEPEGLRIP